MNRSLLKIIALLQEFLEAWKAQREVERVAALKDPLLDSATVMFMLRVGDRTLFNYVKQGKLICEKRGNSNFYLESSVLALMNKTRESVYNFEKLSQLK